MFRIPQIYNGCNISRASWFISGKYSKPTPPNITNNRSQTEHGWHQVKLNGSVNPHRSQWRALQLQVNDLVKNESSVVTCCILTSQAPRLTKYTNLAPVSVPNAKRNICIFRFALCRLAGEILFEISYTWIGGLTIKYEDRENSGKSQYTSIHNQNITYLEHLKPSCPWVLAELGVYHTGSGSN